MKQMEPLDENLTYFFAMEIQSQMRMADLALEQLRHLQNGPPVSGDYYWYHVESLVKSLTAIANILWTTTNRNPHKQRSRKLREAFGLGDMVLPADFRATRNALEHFDEHIDDWWDRSETKNLADRNIGPKHMIAGDIEHARSLDYESGELSVFENTVNLYETYNFLHQVATRVSKRYLHIH